MVGQPADVAAVGVHDVDVEIAAAALAKARRLPSGDQLGLLSRAVSLVRRLMSVPSASAV